MVSSKSISASQRLKCSSDIFFHLGILLRNSVVATVEVCLVSEVVARRCENKKGFLKNFTNFTGKHLSQSLFLIKLHVSGLQHYLKRESGTGVFLWNYEIFKSTIFYRTPQVAASISVELFIIFFAFKECP